MTTAPTLLGFSPWWTIDMSVSRYRRFGIPAQRKLSMPSTKIAMSVLYLQAGVRHRMHAPCVLPCASFPRISLHSLGQKSCLKGCKRRRYDSHSQLAAATDGVDLPPPATDNLLESLNVQLRELVDDICDVEDVGSDVLLQAVMIITRHKYPDMDQQVVMEGLDRLASLVQDELNKSEAPHYPMRICRTISNVLYQQQGFSGAAGSYYNPDNSCINKVLELKVGIPISLSLVYMEVARRVGLEMLGVNLPGHFMIKPKDENVEILVDAFNGGEVCFLEDAERKLQILYGNSNLKLSDSFVRRKQQVPWRAFLGRWLNNLKHVYIQLQQPEDTLAIIRMLRIVRPDSVEEIRDEGLYLAQTHEYRDAIERLELYLKLLPSAEDGEAVREILRLARGAMLNRALKEQPVD